jgi:hypothetical protein
MQVKKVTDLENFRECHVEGKPFETPRFFCDIYCLRPGRSEGPPPRCERQTYRIVRGRREGHRRGRVADAPGPARSSCASRQPHG